MCGGGVGVVCVCVGEWCVGMWGGEGVRVSKGWEMWGEGGEKGVRVLEGETILHTHMSTLSATQPIDPDLKKGNSSVKVALVTLDLMMGVVDDGPLPFVRVDAELQRSTTNLRYSCSRFCRSSTS